MKNNMIKIGLLALFILTVDVAFCQISWPAITQQTGKAETNIKTILKIIAGLAIGIGFIFVLYKKISGKSDSNEYLIGAGVALALYLMAIALGLW